MRSKGCRRQCETKGGVEDEEAMDPAAERQRIRKRLSYALKMAKCEDRADG